MDLVSLLSLRNRAKRAADMENSLFISDSEWNDYLNYGARRLHDVLVSASGDEYLLKSYSFTLVSGQTTYSLPSDFYRERAFDWVTSPKPLSMQRFSFRDRNKYNWVSYRGVPLYCLQGPSVLFMPTPTIAGSGIMLWYIPTLQKTTDSGATWTSGSLSADTDKIDGVNGYEELAVIHAAILAKQKENTDAGLLMARLEEVQRWVEESCHRRNDGDPMFIGDMNNDPGSRFE
jgi:hypothetical protein